MAGPDAHSGPRDDELADPDLLLAEGLPALLPADLAASAEIGGALEVIARRSAGLMSFVDRYRRLADLPAPAKAPLTAESLLTGLRTLMAPLMAERGVGFEDSAKPPDLTIVADPDLLEQELINQQKNALDAAAPGSPAAWSGWRVGARTRLW